MGIIETVEREPGMARLAPCSRMAVTTLRAKARSFSGGVRLKAASQPFDKHGADLVAWEGEMTTGTVVPPLAQVLGHRLTADAGLACAAWVHGYRLPAGSLRLADKDSDELAPRG